MPNPTSPTIPEALLQGLQDYFDASDLRVNEWRRQRLAGGLSGSTLERWWLHLQGAGHISEFELIYKRGAVVTGAFMQGAPQREALVYQQLSPNIPLTMPSVIAVVPARGDIWMRPFAPSKLSNHWSASWDQSDVEQTLTDLARLHARFWGKTEQLTRQPWLAQPIRRDAEALLHDAQEGLEQIIADAAYDRSLISARVRHLLTLAQHYQGLLEFLEATPSTLLHGDAGFQNIAVSVDGGVRVWYDWQLSGVGPAALDLVTYLHPWAYPLAQPPLSLPEMVELYLVKLQREGVYLNKTLFARQLDAAFIWRWLCQWAPLLGKYRARLRDDIRQRLYHVFARLQWPALARNQGLNN